MIHSQRIRVISSPLISTIGLRAAWRSRVVGHGEVAGPGAGVTDSVPNQSEPKGRPRGAGSQAVGRADAPERRAFLNAERF